MNIKIKKLHQDAIIHAGMTDAEIIEALQEYIMTENKPMPFRDRIEAMNKMYGLPVVDVPTLPVDVERRLNSFEDILIEELNEKDDIVDNLNNGSPHIKTLTEIADWLGDITVYCRSEAMKYGIPLEQVIDIIMDSNESKLDADGQPIINEHGKFEKGPNYWKPEPKIKDLLERTILKSGVR